LHEYIQMPTPASILYVVYWAACAGYGAFVLAASIVAPQYRQRVHRGSWLHVIEGWALVAVLWAACGWARHEVLMDAAAWSGQPPTPHGVVVATIVFWAVLPPALTALFVMTITTIVRAWPQPTVPAS